MALTRRYSPEHPPGERCNFGLSYEAVIPLGVGISSASLTIFTNDVDPVAADADWTVEGLQVMGRIVFATLSGGVDGKDYQLRWSATDTDQNVWPRTGLIRVAQTS